MERTWKTVHGIFWLTIIRENNKPPNILFSVSAVDRYSLTPEQLKQTIQNLHQQLESTYKDFLKIQPEIEKTL